MIGGAGERSARTSGELARETAELRPPERQRGLLSFLTWPILLAQASLAEAALGDTTASLRAEEEEREAAAARSDAPRPPAPSDDQPSPAAGSAIGREVIDAPEEPAVPGAEQDFARVKGAEADGEAQTVAATRRSESDPQAGGGGGGGGGSASARSPDARAEPRAPRDDAPAVAAPDAMKGQGPAGPVGHDQPVPPGEHPGGMPVGEAPVDASQPVASASGESAQPSSIASQSLASPSSAASAPAAQPSEEVGETLIGNPLTGVADTGLGTVAAVVESVPPVVTGVSGAAADLVEAALQPAGAVLDVMAPVVDGVVPIVTDVVDGVLQPVGSTLETLPPVVARLGATVTEVVDAVPPVVESVPSIVTDVADVARGVVDVALEPVGSALELVPPVVESVPAIVTDVADIASDVVDVALQPVESVLETLSPVVESLPPLIMDLAEAATDLGDVPRLAETAADIAGIAAEDIATLVESVSPVVTDVAGAATDAGKTLVATALDSVRIGGDARADADAAGDTSVARDAKDLRSKLMDSDDGLDVIGTLGGALASGGVIVIDGAPPPARASADDGRYTDVDLALRDLALDEQRTKPADGRTNDRAVETADAPHGSHDKTGESAGPPSAREHDGADKLGTATLLGGLTDSVDEIVLRGDHHLL
jgi:hypothetical protein